MSDWDETLSPADKEAWDSFVRHAREGAAQGIMESAFVMSIVPSEEADIKFCVELGLAIMYDKPLLLIVSPETLIPERLRRAADEIIVADLDTEEGREIVKDALAGMEE